MIFKRDNYLMPLSFQNSFSFCKFLAQLTSIIKCFKTILRKYKTFTYHSIDVNGRTVKERRVRNSWHIYKRYTIVVYF